MPSTEIHIHQEEEEIPNLGTFHIAKAGIQRNLELLNGLEIARARDIARGRTFCNDYQSLLSEHWSFAREAVIYFPRSNHCIFLANSPLLLDPARASTLHESGREYEINPSPYLSIAEEDDSKEPAERRAILFPTRNQILSFKTLRLDEYPIMRFMWGDAAQDYGRFMYNHGAKALEVYLLSQSQIDQNRNVFVRQIWIGCSDARSPIQCDWTFSDFDRIRGIARAG